MTVALAVLATACHSDGYSAAADVPSPDLRAAATYDLDLHEPSGLSLGAGSLWAVDGDGGDVARLTLTGRTSAVVTRIPADLEGIAFDARDSTLWIVEERRRAVVHLDRAGQVLQRAELPLGGAPNSGLEGIDLGPGGQVCVLQEKDPARLLTLTADLAIDGEYLLDFAADVSGLAWDSVRQAFWIASDQDGAVYLWSPQAGLLGRLDHGIRKVEGIACDQATGVLYLVSEAGPTLHVWAPAP